MELLQDLPPTSNFPYSLSLHLPQRSRSRLNVLLGYKDAPVARNSTGAHDLMGKWDLGTRRSLAQLIDFTGVDTINREVGEGEKGKGGRKEVVFQALHAMAAHFLYRLSFILSYLTQVIHSSCQRLAWVPFERPGEGIDDDIDPFHAQRLLGERQQGQLEENSRLTPAMWKSWSAKVKLRDDYWETLVSLWEILVFCAAAACCVFHQPPSCPPCERSLTTDSTLLALVPPIPSSSDCPLDHYNSVAGGGCPGGCFCQAPAGRHLLLFFALLFPLLLLPQQQ